MENQFNKIPNIHNEDTRVDIPRIQVQTESPEDEPENVMWIDFQSGDDAEGVKSAGVETYVISPITEQDLFSDKYLNCTGVVGIGRDKASGKEIAFISHQDPKYFINKGPEFTGKFVNDLKSTLNELIARSVKDTVEVVIFGGKIDPAKPESKVTIEYQKSKDILNSTAREVIGKDPTVINEPSSTEGAIDVTVITQKRKILISK